MLRPKPLLAVLATDERGGGGCAGAPPTNAPIVDATLPKPTPLIIPPIILLVSTCRVGLSNTPNEAGLIAAINGDAGL